MLLCISCFILYHFNVLCKHILFSFCLFFKRKPDLAAVHLMAILASKHVVDESLYIVFEAFLLLLARKLLWQINAALVWKLINWRLLVESFYCVLVPSYLCHKNLVVFSALLFLHLYAFLFALYMRFRTTDILYSHNFASLKNLYSVKSFRRKLHKAFSICKHFIFSDYLVAPDIYTNVDVQYSICDI